MTDERLYSTGPALRKHHLRDLRCMFMKKIQYKLCFLYLFHHVQFPCLHHSYLNNSHANPACRFLFNLLRLIIFKLLNINDQLGLIHNWPSKIMLTTFPWHTSNILPSHMVQIHITSVSTHWTGSDKWKLHTVPLRQRVRLERTSGYKIIHSNVKKFGEVRVPT